MFTGKKKDMDEVVDQQIILHDFKIMPSQYAEKYKNDKCLMMQIEMDGRKYVCFSGSKYLQMQLAQVTREQLPRSTVIKRIDKKLFFT